MATFGERLRELRIEQGLTQTQFGEAFGRATSTISGYENGTIEVKGKRLEAFADFFKVPICYLLGRSDDRGPSQVREGTPAWPVGGDVTPEEREHLRRYLAWIRHEDAER